MSRRCTPLPPNCADTDNQSYSLMHAFAIRIPSFLRLDSSSSRDAQAQDTHPLATQARFLSKYMHRGEVTKTMSDHPYHARCDAI